MPTPAEKDVVPAYHLLSAEHAIGSISRRRLKVARFSEVNDPFELLAMDCMKRERRKALSAFKKAQDRTNGMLCFSGSWKNPVLWSHYAHGGGGICLGFHITRTLGIKGVLKVNYEDSKLRALGDDPDPGSISEAFQELLFVTKFRHWQYEAEQRVLVDLSKATKDGTLYFYPFSDELCLKEVILGPLCPLSLLEQIRNLTRATNPGAVVSKARLGFKYFEVKPDGRYKPRQ